MLILNILECLVLIEEIYILGFGFVVLGCEFLLVIVLVFVVGYGGFLWVCSDFVVLCIFLFCCCGCGIVRFGIVLWIIRYDFD